MQETIKETVAKVLTEISEPSTKATPKTTIIQRFQRATKFDTFGDPELKHMFEAAQVFAASINYTEPYWLTLTGKSGIGKTHLARAVWKQWMDQNRFEVKFDKARNRIYGNTGSYINWRELCSQLRSGDYDWIETLCREDFVILDDIGSERDPTGFIASNTDILLNGRLRKWTMITTNLSLKEIADKMDTRIASRMLRDGSVVVECKALDYNLRQPATA